VGFSQCKAPLFIISHIIVDELCKIFCFFNLVLKRFSSNLILIEDQLILISYGRVRLKEERLKWKMYQTWMSCYKFAKDALLSLNFRMHANYIISIPQCFIQYFIGVLGKKYVEKQFFQVKKLQLDFSTTIVVRIWANQTMYCLIFFFQKTLGWIHLQTKKLKVQSCGPWQNRSANSAPLLIFFSKFVIQFFF
jgi:hypothetical protein